MKECKKHKKGKASRGIHKGIGTSKQIETDKPKEEKPKGGKEINLRKNGMINRKPSEELSPTQARIKALFEADGARREKDPELEKERMRREKAVISARNRIREFIRIDLESRKIKEDKKIGKNEIILEGAKCEDKKEEKLFEGFSKEDYFKGFDAFKENLSSEFKARLKKGKVEKNEIIIEDEKKEEDKKEDKKIDQSEITFGNKSLAESIYNDKSIKKSENSDDEDNQSNDGRCENSDDEVSVSKLTLGSDFD